MAITVSTNNAVNNGNPTSENGASFTYTGAFSTEDAGYLVNYGFEGDLYVQVGSGYLQSKTYNKTWNNQPSDQTFSIRAWAHRYKGAGEDGWGNYINLKTNAMAMAGGNIQATNIQQSSATIDSDYNPRTHESNATVWLEYKRSADSTWIQAGSADVVSGFHGSVPLNISRNLSGLDPGTQYDFRLRASRNTNNDQNFTGGTQTFSTTSLVSLFVTTH